MYLCLHNCFTNALRNTNCEHWKIFETRKTNKIKIHEIIFVIIIKNKI